MSKRFVIVYVSKFIISHSYSTIKSAVDTFELSVLFTKLKLLFTIALFFSDTRRRFRTLVSDNIGNRTKYFRRIGTLGIPTRNHSESSETLLNYYEYNAEIRSRQRVFFLFTRLTVRVEVRTRPG